MPPVMHSVYSSNVSSVGHDAETNSMHVAWKSGKTSIYENVPPQVVTDVRNSHSVSKAIRADIIPHYTHRYAS